MRNGHVAAASKQYHRSSDTKIEKSSGNDTQKNRSEMHELTREVAVAGLAPGGVAAQEAAEGGGAVALQPCRQKLHPLLRDTTEAVSRKPGRSSCLFLQEEGYSHRGLWPDRSEASG